PEGKDGEHGVQYILGGHGKRYCSYRGKVGKTAPNILGRDFSADSCLRKAVTDMLSRLHRKFPHTRNRILHSDQGWQYQREAYRNRLAEYGIIQSMSRKGNCLDNSKTENLFSKRKKEMFYGHEKEFRSFAELKKAIDEYVDWYNKERIVQRLGGAPVSNRSIEPVPLLRYSPT
ncbi:MAG: IS3 family transposase, partial [Candidatus Enterosoma sp.]|nr:IS3 family transposase [Candidatus Enterosoma sp.]